MNNEEITNIVKILGLHYSKKYSDSTDLRGLRYGKLLIMTDQDQDGSHIKGLVINFLHHNWPSLIRHDFVQEFITPIVKVGGEGGGEGGREGGREGRVKVGGGEEHSCQMVVHVVCTVYMYR